jgi:arylsulfatase
MWLSDFHVSPTCSATRSKLMTGRHDFKNGVTHGRRKYVYHAEPAGC